MDCTRLQTGKQLARSSSVSCKICETYRGSRQKTQNALVFKMRLHSLSFPFLPQRPSHTKPHSGKTGTTERKVLSLRKALTLSETAKECMKMSNNSNNQLNIPEAREAMDRFKMQAAQDHGVTATYRTPALLRCRNPKSIKNQRYAHLAGRQCRQTIRYERWW